MSRPYIQINLLYQHGKKSQGCSHAVRCDSGFKRGMLAQLARSNACDPSPPGSSVLDSQALIMRRPVSQLVHVSTAYITGGIH
jgi:hypothetical protein